MRFYRRERDIQLAGNQLIAGAFAHHADDFPLFRRQDGGQIIFFLQAVANGQLYQRQHRLGPLALFAGERHVAHQRDTGDDPPLAADKDLGHVAHVIRQHKFMIVMPVAVAEPRRHRRHGGVLVAKVRRQKRIQRLEVFQILLVRIIGNIMQYIVFGF